MPIRRIGLISLIVISFVVIFMMATVTQHAQQKSRSLRLKNWFGVPIKISGFSLKTPLSITDENDRAIVLNDDLKNGVIEVKNLSDGTITLICIELVFSNSVRDVRPLVFPIFLGFNENFGPVNESKRIAVRTSESMKLEITDATHRGMLRALAASGCEDDFDQISLRLGPVYFDDDTGWMWGIKMRRSPDDPRKWLPASPVGRKR